MKKTKIVVIEDEPDILESVVRGWAYQLVSIQSWPMEVSCPLRASRGPGARFKFLSHLLNHRN
jgi:hypothetical protein